ncbi:MAG: hypothetical protein KIS94_06455 [Chitinophagales bacterium]|nr:hypothetical protein [Chitinophagales bacterium]
MLLKRFKTTITQTGIEISNPEVEVNLLDCGAEPALPLTHPAYQWEFSISISTDRDAADPPLSDMLTCYLNATLHCKGQTLFIVKLNTLHSYCITPLNYKKTHTQLFKNIARESLQQANTLLAQKVNGTAWQGIVLPELDEDFLEEDAHEWNRRGYIPQPAKRTIETPGKKPSKAEFDELTARANRLVQWIDAADAAGGPQTDAEKIKYYANYAEWVKLNNVLWHFKLIALNQIACLSTRIMERMEKQLQQNPHNELLRESYESMIENYVNLMDELKNQFAKN